MNALSFFKKLPPSRINLINLGCARNLVDSQIILGQLRSYGHQWADISRSDSVVINTCAFIDQAKQETVDTILEMVDLKKSGKIKNIIVLGCFSQRYPDEMRKEFPEVDFIGGVLPFSKKQILPSLPLTSSSFAYVKICESCYHHCSFCVIPQLKGPFTSRYVESILHEIKSLDRKNIKEINIIGQDITAYGLDIYKERSLSILLKKIIQQIVNIRWVRLLYLFPAHIDEELLGLIKNERKICRYLDLPLQHINDRILKSMNRKMLAKKTISLIQKIRKTIPGVCLRTSFIVGYPGETEQEFQELCDFVKNFAFDKVGVFVYSQEEGTRSARMPHQISDHVKQQRYATLMEIQQKISRKRLKKFLNQTITVLVDEKEKSDKMLYIGRSERDAPEIDGVVFVRSDKILKPGTFVQAKVIDSYEYDLVARYERISYESAK